MATYESVGYNSPDGMQLGTAATHKVAFYGAAPVAQRAAAVQAASVLSVSSNTTIAASLVNWILEVTATFVGLGIWKGSA